MNGLAESQDSRLHTWKYGTFKGPTDLMTSTKIEFIVGNINQSKVQDQGW